MKNLLIFSVLAILSTQLFADSVRINPDVDLAVYGVTDTTFLLNSEEPSGDATDETKPALVYVPVQSGVTNQADYFLLKGSNSAPNYLFDATDVTHVIHFPLYLNVSTTDKYLYAAVKDGSDYKLVRAYGTVLNNITNGSYRFPVSPQEICLRVTTPKSCANLNPSYDGSEELDSLLMYFFLSTQSSLTIGDTVDMTTHTGGIYFKVGMSNRIYPTLVTTVNKVRPGDRRAILEYTASTTILKPDHLRVFDTGASASVMAPIGQLTGTLLAKEYSYIQNSEVTVTDLANSQSYNLGVMFVDKYNFTTQVSATQAVQPQEIQELLKKNACYFLTAGFGEDHFVIEYFRSFRDTVLAKNYLGRVFINVYYETAPKYALMIYHNEAIRAVIRGLAYTLYFIFNFYYLFIAGLAIIGTALWSSRRTKFSVSK